MSISRDLGLKPEHKAWICPYSHLSEKLSETLSPEHVELCGFLDQNRTGANIVDYNLFTLGKNEKVLIISPNHALDIYKLLVKQGIPKNKLRLIKYLPESHQQFKLSSPVSLCIKNTLSTLIRLSLDKLFSVLKKIFEAQNQALFICPDFVDLNAKDLYLALESETTVTAYIATDNEAQLKKLSMAGFNTVRFNSLHYLYRCLSAKIKILDHNLVGDGQDIALKGSFCVQIWHGIPLKKIGHLANYKRNSYDLVVSTSSYVTNYAFKSLFLAKSFIECGYPRNDILTEFSKPVFQSKKRLALVNHPIYNWVVNSNKKLIVYMPTWRCPGTERNPLDLDSLNQFAKSNDLLVIVKLHPFVRANTYYDCLNKNNNANEYEFSEGYSDNLLFYPSTDDIYPLLARSEALITDYSSVFFDYLIFNKPLIFFCYDFASYETKHGEFMLNFDDNTPGYKPRNTDQLLAAIANALENDNFEDARATLRRRLFNDDYIGKSGQILAKTIEQRCIRLSNTELPLIHDCTTKN